MKKITILILALVVTGCATITNKSGPSTLETYGLTQDELWELSVIALKNYNFSISKFNKQTGFIGGYRAWLGSPVENVTVNIGCDGDGYCRTTVMSTAPTPARWNYNTDPEIASKILEMLESR